MFIKHAHSFNLHSGKGFGLILSTLVISVLTYGNPKEITSSYVGFHS
jgi:hypothetical protein